VIYSWRFARKDASFSADSALDTTNASGGAIITFVRNSGVAIPFRHDGRFAYDLQVPTTGAPTAVTMDIVGEASFGISVAYVNGGTRSVVDVIDTHVS